MSLTTYAILNYLFLHEFALKVRLTEKSGKLGIGSKKILQAVRGTSQLHCLLVLFVLTQIRVHHTNYFFAESVRVSYPQATDKDLNRYIGCWFRTSADRKGGRKRRCQNGNTSENNKAPRKEGTGDNSEGDQNGDNSEGDQAGDSQRID